MTTLPNTNDIRIPEAAYVNSADGQSRFPDVCLLLAYSVATSGHWQGPSVDTTFLSFLLAPSDPSKWSAEENCVRYYIVKEVRKNQFFWHFVRDKVRYAPRNLNAVLWLCEVPTSISEKKIHDYIKRAPVPTEGVLDFWYHTWVISVLESLPKKLLKKTCLPSGGGKVVYKTGMQFSRGTRLGEQPGVPCCNMSGDRLTLTFPKEEDDSMEE